MVEDEVDSHWGAEPVPCLFEVRLGRELLDQLRLGLLISSAMTGLSWKGLRRLGSSRLGLGATVWSACAEPSVGPLLYRMPR